MTQRIIDPADGGFRIDDHLRITRLTELKDIVVHFGEDRMKITDHKNGNVSVNIRNVNVSGFWFCLTFAFLNGMLQGIGFVVDAKEFDLTRGWESCSEAEEMRLLKFGENWLYQQTGTMERLFPWGRIFAYSDAKTGDTHLGLRYE